MKNKKKLAIIISAVVLAVAVISTGTFAFALNVAKKNSIGIDRALSIAMNDAGAKEEDTVVTKAKLEMEKSIFVYDIEFTVNGIDEYEYTIKSSDGTIIDKNYERDDDKLPTKAETTTAQAPQPTTSGSNEVENSNNSGNGNEISLEEAKNIALKNAGVAQKDAAFTSAHKDYDDGITYYEIDFRTATVEYEYEIDLKGKIISAEKEKIRKEKPKVTTQSSSATAKYIGVDSAKKIALKNSGLSQSSVVFTKAKLERDDAKHIYEIEFNSSTTEYEYEIDAVSGKIIDKSAESFDYD